MIRGVTPPPPVSSKPKNVHTAGRNNSTLQFSTSTHSAMKNTRECTSSMDLNHIMD
jgi:hypothetical protein